MKWKDGMVASPLALITQAAQDSRRMRRLLEGADRAEVLQ